MFICGICRQPAPPKEKPTIIPTKLRRKAYPARPIRDKRGYILSWASEGQGYEIATEALACRRCAPEALERFEEMKKQMKEMEEIYAKEARAYKQRDRERVRDHYLFQEAHPEIYR